MGHIVSTNLVETSSHINWRRLNDIINHVRQGSQKITRIDLGVEEDLRCQKALIPHINRSLLSTELLNNVFLETLGLTVETGELLHDVGTDVAEFLFDLLRCFEGGIGFATVSEERLHKVGDVSTGNGDGFDGGTDDISFGLREA